MIIYTQLHSFDAFVEGLFVLVWIQRVYEIDHDIMS